MEPGGTLPVNPAISVPSAWTFTPYTGQYAIQIDIKGEATVWEYRGSLEDAKQRARDILMDGLEHTPLLGTSTVFYPPSQIKKIAVYPQQAATVTTTPYAPYGGGAVCNAPAIEPDALADAFNKTFAKMPAYQTYHDGLGGQGSP